MRPRAAEIGTDVAPTRRLPDEERRCAHLPRADTVLSPCATSSHGVGFGIRTAAVELPGDLLTPFGVFCLLDQQQSAGGDAFLFEGALGRYSYVGVGGSGTSRRARTAASRLTFVGGRLEKGAAEGLPSHPLEALRAALEAIESEKPEGLPPFCGGYVGYLGWAAAGWSEKIPQRLGPDPFFPESDLLHVTEVVSFDHRQGRAWAVATSADDPERRAQALARRVLAVFEDAKEGVNARSRLRRRGADADGRSIRWPDALRRPAAQSLAARMFGAKRRPRGLLEPKPVGGGERAFKAAVKKALDYIYAGDIFQVVLSQRFELPDCDGFSLYRTLRVASPAPYHFYLRLSGRELFGASPELLVEVDEGEMIVRPIAGTRRRGETAKEDERLERDLKADPKECAEHTMLVDLGRNDVGRVSRIGSVRVPRLMEIERFSHVMHLVSEVTGKLKPGLGSVDAFSAAFPAGTLSGAPKIRALEIIDELETVQRGPYGGAVGWFSGAGDVQLAIAIRTLFRSGGRLFAHAGAGIVADSTPDREWQEVLAKVRASVGAAYGAVAGREQAVAEAATR